jgi:hypothetical protein
MKIIIDYINANQGCTAQDIVDGVKDKISRVPVFDIIRQLVQDEVVRDNKLNRRNHRYFIADNNLLVTVPRELDAFISNFFSLLEKIQLFLTNDANFTSRDDRKYYKIRLLDPAVSIFFSQIIRYNSMAISSWPTKIKDPDVLNKLYIEVFSKFNIIRDFLSNKYKQIPPEIPYPTGFTRYVFTPELRFNLISWKDSLRKLRIENDISSIVEDLEGISYYRGEKI